MIDGMSMCILSAAFTYRYNTDFRAIIYNADSPDVLYYLDDFSQVNQGSTVSLLKLTVCSDAAIPV